MSRLSPPDARPDPGRLTCRPRCHHHPGRRAHHDALLRVEDDPDALLDLFETAVTWAELDHPADTTIPPAAWLDFARDHRWRDSQRVLRLFGLATDVALRPTPAHRGLLLSAAGR